MRTVCGLAASMCAGAMAMTACGESRAVEPVSRDAAAWLPATPEKLPRWRGFNLLEKFQRDRNEPFREEDFRLIARLGFNFVRLPMDYRTWIAESDWTRFNEKTLQEIDRAVAFGGRYGIHVCLNFHRAPGYTVASPPEPTSLWTDPQTQKVCARHWAVFARRYKGIPNTRLSFNLVNEPSKIDGATYRTVARMLVEAIRAEDPDRLIIADGLDWGTRPCPELRDLHVAQAARGYAPFHLTHYKATWVGDTSWMPEPAWPRRVRNGPPEDAAWLWETAVRPWIEARERGIGVMVGEWGAFNKTPHPVVLAWAEDCLRNWQKAGFGWALWNFRGSFGILDSGRSDVAYDDFEGHQLDRKLLHLLQRY